MMEIRIPVVTGATASGKSALLYRLFDEGLRFELVSADAFQVYQRLDIGTAKPDVSLRKRIPHHLIDIIPTDGSYDAGDFAEQAEEVIEDILSRGVMPVVAGGTGLYIRSLMEGLFDSPPVDEELRASLKKRIEDEGSQTLFEELKKVDPEYASVIHQNDAVRIIRAMEVYLGTGMPISGAHKKLSRKPKYSYDLMILDKERSRLYDDIDTRVASMIEAGWVDEVRGLLDMGITEDMPSFRAIGYRDLAQTVQGKLPLEASVEIIARKTRNYAKRQLTWFRGTKDAVFMDENAIKERLYRHKEFF